MARKKFLFASSQHFVKYSVGVDEQYWLVTDNTFRQMSNLKIKTLDTKNAF